MARKNQVAVAIPIYKHQFEGLEQFSIDYSLAVLKNRDCTFVAPAGLDCGYYAARYPRVRFEFFPAEYFVSVESYSRLLLNPDYYQRFADFEFVLLLQPDAILLADHIDHWSAQPYDYIGAPWPDGVELTIKLDRFRGDLARPVRAYVGNGGLSLRRVRKCLALIKEFPETHFMFSHTGTNEDSFFSLLGQLSGDFLVPNQIVASRFSMELRPEYYHVVNGGHYPMGVHAWAVVNPTFWAPCVPPLANVLKTV